MTNRLIRATLVALFMLPAACGVTDPDISEIGIVRFIQVEGGCWGIAVNEDMYEPINLSAAFREDGLRVSFQAMDRPDLASICQIGRIVEIKTIRRLEPPAGSGARQAGWLPRVSDAQASESVLTSAALATSS